MYDWVSEMFPGDGLEKPSDAERAKADQLVGSAIARQHFGRMCAFADSRTNRAFMRSRVRRWWYGSGRV